MGTVETPVGVHMPAEKSLTVSASVGNWSGKAPAQYTTLTRATSCTALARQLLPWLMTTTLGAHVAGPAQFAAGHAGVHIVMAGPCVGKTSETLGTVVQQLAEEGQLVLLLNQWRPSEISTLLFSTDSSTTRSSNVE